MSKAGAFVGPAALGEFLEGLFDAPGPLAPQTGLLVGLSSLPGGAGGGAILGAVPLMPACEHNAFATAAAAARFNLGLCGGLSVLGVYVFSPGAGGGGGAGDALATELARGACGGRALLVTVAPRAPRVAARLFTVEADDASPGGGGGGLARVRAAPAVLRFAGGPSRLVRATTSVDLDVALGGGGDDAVAALREFAERVGSGVWVIGGEPTRRAATLSASGGAGASAEGGGATAASAPVLAVDVFAQAGTTRGGLPDELVQHFLSGCDVTDTLCSPRTPGGAAAGPSLLHGRLLAECAYGDGVTVGVMAAALAQDVLRALVQCVAEEASVTGGCGPGVAPLPVCVRVPVAAAGGGGPFVLRTWARAGEDAATAAARALTSALLPRDAAAGAPVFASGDSGTVATGLRAAASMAAAESAAVAAAASLAAARGWGGLGVRDDDAAVTVDCGADDAGSHAPRGAGASGAAPLLGAAPPPRRLAALRAVADADDAEGAGAPGGEMRQRTTPHTRVPQGAFADADAHPTEAAPPLPPLRRSGGNDSLVLIAGGVVLLLFALLLLVLRRGGRGNDHGAQGE